MYLLHVLIITYAKVILVFTVTGLRFFKYKELELQIERHLLMRFFFLFLFSQKSTSDFVQELAVRVEFGLVMDSGLM